MKIGYIVLFFACFYGISVAGHVVEEELKIINDCKLEQSNEKMVLKEYLNGVKYALIELNDTEQKKIDSNGSILMKHFKQYLKNIGFEKVVVTSEEKKALQYSVPSYCDITKVKLEVSLVKKTLFTNHRIEFTTCNGDYFKLSSQDTLYNDAYLIDKLHTLWGKLYDGEISYDKTKRLTMPKQMTAWEEESLKAHFMLDKGDKMQGVYEKILNDANDNAKYRIALVKNEEGNYDGVYLDGATNYEDWQAGEIIAKVVATGTLNFYDVEWRQHDKILDDDVYLSVDQSNMLFFNFVKNNEQSYRYFKVYPKNRTPHKQAKATGTGIAISDKGHIITNYHVVQGGNIFEVQIVYQGQKKIYNASLLEKDIINDLAILKIEDWDFQGLPNIPYRFKTSLADVGEGVFTLGYPLTGTMGEEIKLTDGLISAKTGFKGDVSTYQVTVPVHPGNSGGPLFDKNGNLLGIIKAKHSKAESATYAIKTRNVLNLIELLDERVVLPIDNKLEGQALQEQVKSLNQYVFLIKVYE